MKTDQEFFADVTAELARARTKFPGHKHTLAALHEESGELAMAMLDHEYGKGPASDVYAEAVQVAAMACRVALEGDSDFLYEPV